jgi:hypothetical protein
MKVAEICFLEQIWNTTVIPTYSKTGNFEEGFRFSFEKTKGLLELNASSSDREICAIRTALDGLESLNKSGGIERSRANRCFFMPGDYKKNISDEKIFSGITNFPYFHGAVLGVNYTAGIILLDRYNPSFILGKLEEFAKEKGTLT